MEPEMSSLQSKQGKQKKRSQMQMDEDEVMFENKGARKQQMSSPKFSNINVLRDEDEDESVEDINMFVPIKKQKNKEEVKPREKARQE